MSRNCDGASGMRKCPHPDECMVECQFNNAVVTRTIKPYPAVVPDEAVEVVKEWRSIEEMLTIGVWAVTLIITTLLVFSCLFMWGKIV